MAELTDEDLRPLTDADIEQAFQDRLSEPIMPTIEGRSDSSDFVYQIGSQPFTVNTKGKGKISIDGTPVDILVDLNGDPEDFRLFHIEYGNTDGETSETQGDTLALAANDAIASTIFLDNYEWPILSIDQIEADDVGLG